MRPLPGWSTTLRSTFEQIAEFCGLHILEVQAIADDTAATKLTGRDPVRAHELTMDEIEKGQKDPELSSQDAEGPRAGPPHQGPALHAGLQAPGQAGRHRLDPPQPSGGLGRRDRQADRHHRAPPSPRSATAATGTSPTSCRKDPVTLGPHSASASSTPSSPRPPRPPASRPRWTRRLRATARR